MPGDVSGAHGTCFRCGFAQIEEHACAERAVHNAQKPVGGQKACEPTSLRERCHRSDGCVATYICVEEISSGYEGVDVSSGYLQCNRSAGLTGASSIMSKFMMDTAEPELGQHTSYDR